MHNQERCEFPDSSVAVLAVLYFGMEMNLQKDEVEAVEEYEGIKRIKRGVK